MKYGIHDGPGIRTIVFLKGCQMRCWWCHNPEGQRPGLEVMLWGERCIGCGECLKACRHGAIVDAADGERPIHTLSEKCTVCGDCVKACYAGARTIVGRVATVDQVMEEIRKDRAFYEESGGGATFSGGEPMSQAEFLDALLQECKREELHTAVETTGFAKLEDLLRAGEKTDLFLYDLKLIDDEEHRKHTGVSNGVILDNLKALSLRHGNIIVRIPIIPGVTDTDRNLLKMGEFLSGLDDVREVHLLPYHKAGVGKYARLGKGYDLPALQPPSEQAMNGIAERLKNCGKRVKIGG
ncbi:MAG: glycyl-radical enzyme activating protein [Firmicutes bacterium]|nr:glycyl-radical enzyme activating protein [Bacillota bacterium]